MTEEEKPNALRENDQEIAFLKKQVQERDEHITQLEQLVTQLSEQIKALQERQAKDSHNSSLPPSSDRFSRQKKAKSLREKSGKKSGGQPGHPGSTLQMSETPDGVISLPPVTCCQQCHTDLSLVPIKTVERRQVIDVPKPRLETLEYQGEWKQCPECQQLTAAPFPQEAKASTQFGPRLGAMAVYLMVQHLLPLGRTKETLGDLLGVSLSEATLVEMQARAAKTLEPIEEQTKAALIAEKVLHQDESGLYVQGERWWVHVACTDQLTHYAAHPSRGQDALKAIGILPQFQGTSIHDGWLTSFLFLCKHALCGVHLLRELTFLAQEQGLLWARQLLRLLLDMRALTMQARAEGKSALSAAVIADWTTKYEQILAQAEALHPHALAPPGKKKPGKVKQSAARNLLDRLQTYQDAVLAFLSDLDVDFDKNQAERDIRMIKVQQKVSGTFRSVAGVVNFLRIRGYLSTLRKQGQPQFSALEATLRGQPILPSFEVT
jgi:transposase